ncbi:TIGR03089 family protein [Kocuria sp. ZOR0020]|uniref:TIGR03089 family protein n=1 Tax=Kocuria sp. ZOR0020 TaxID=1339234 RepID=UPI000689EED3|nr:TIGR03089 family protein [Kocuria sp. ZOR0020]
MPTISSPRSAQPQSVPALLQSMAQQPTPALVFYGHDGGRVELSGRVLENWVAKTANLLVDDLGLMPADRVLLEPTVHWRTAVVVAGVWRVGATVVLADSSENNGAGVALAVTMAPDAQRSSAEGDVFGAAAGDLMVLAYPALAMELDPSLLPAGAIDFCAEIRAHGDHYADAGASAADQELAVVGHSQHLSLAELMAQAQEQAADLRTGSGPVNAVHLNTATWSPESFARLLAAWMTGTTVVITDRPGTDVAHLLSTERVGLTWS